jgi:hypothetical protein
LGQSCQETDEGRRPHGPDLHGVEDWLEVREGLAQPRHKAPRHGEEGWKTGGVESSRDRRCEESPAPPPGLLSLQTDNQGEREGEGAFGPHCSGRHGGDFPGLQAVSGPPGGAGHHCSPAQSHLDSPHDPYPNQTWCLDAPTPAGTVQRRVLVPLLFLSLGS